VVERAVETLDELFRRNEDLEAAATRYKSDALAAQAQVRQLLSEIDSIKKDRESRVAYAKDRISKLEAEVEALRYELGSANENLNESNQNLANFSSQITKLLHDAPQKLMEINQRN
jgi:predicted  nucleic acid-binding Zn-ribbon protein